MNNPYGSLPDRAFWRRAVSARPPEAVDPADGYSIRLGDKDRVATAGSCFAQHIARAMTARGFAVMTEEGDRASSGPDAVIATMFSAAYGNIYTARQLLQLFQRAYGLFDPQDVAWRRRDGRYVDPFRPLVREAGFANPDEVGAARAPHMAAVRRVFERCDLFVFTLGLTECWAADADGAVFPIAPGVTALADSDDYHFVNLTVDEVVGDMTAWLSLMGEVNPTCRVLLTVSPVPLVATYAPRHVLVSTVASKAILRTAADMLVATHEGVDYFPSFEIITGPQTRGRFYADDLRSITQEGVDAVMNIFFRHVVGSDGPSHVPMADTAAMERSLARMQALGAIICDEDRLDAPDASA